MAKDIEEFLRQAAARRKQRANQQQAPAQPARPTRTERPPASRPRRTPPLDAEVVDDVQVVGHGSVGEHVESYLDSSDIAQHARELGNSLRSTSAQVEQRIHDKFDHDVGQLAEDHIPDQGELSAQAIYADQDEVPQISRDILNLFRSPGNVRQAIIMNEILNRPNWD